ncbi:MAG TPA: hypothetical protein VGQ46_18770 [Thermoanaerobaculia bacterium]|nr:hypothetical protein [Thermoanaerobaculia bacterium]
MENPYQEEADRIRAMIVAAEQLLVKELGVTPATPPKHQSRRLRKVTPAVIRRSIAGLRSGEMRPIDPSKDPMALADELEAGLKILDVLKQISGLFHQMADALSFAIEHKLEKPLAEAMKVYRAARELARTSDNENLKEHVRRMDRALGRGPRR